MIPTPPLSHIIPLACFSPSPNSRLLTHLTVPVGTGMCWPGVEMPGVLTPGLEEKEDMT